jgi:hypothetical protein
MAFQFTCPQGHLLEADESQMGQPCACPQCGTPFAVPTLITHRSPSGPAPAGPWLPGVRAVNPGQPSGQAGPIPDVAGQGHRRMFDFLAQADAQPASSHVAENDPTGGQAEPTHVGPVADVASWQPVPGGSFIAAVGGVAEQPQLYHIPCPRGHELEVPHDMLNQDVLCPFCHVQFRLRHKNSVEAKRKRQAEQEKIDARRGRIWLNWAVFFAVVVVAGVIVLAVMAGLTR